MGVRVVVEKRIIVCGGRDYDNQKILDFALSALTQKNDVIVNGGATGADRMAREWAKRNGRIPETHPADWSKFGKRAGPIRNRLMAWLGADKVIAFKGGRGTMDMVRVAFEIEIPVTFVADDAVGIFISPLTWQDVELRPNPWSRLSWQ